MGYNEAQIMSTLRIGRIVNALVDPRLIPNDLMFLKRTPIIPTSDGEIIARVLNQVMTADIIADDQKSHVYAAQRVKFELNHIPKIKIGYAMTEQMMQLYSTLKMSTQPQQTDVDMFTRYMQDTTKNVIRGVQQRMEALIIAMHCDQMSPTYNNLGIMFGQGLSWGMWSDLKAVTANAWSDPVNATPVNDIYGLSLVGSTKYGKNFDRVTMSTAAFRLMIATTEFQNKARTFLAPNVSYVNLPLANLIQQQALAQNVLGKELELYDARYPTSAHDGTPPTYMPYLPLGLVILSTKSNDNNQNIMDWGNTMPSETLMGDATGIIGGPFPAPQYGPVAYATPNNINLDPAGYTTYGVARGFPRKFELAATACLNVGAVADILSPTINFNQ